MATIDLFDGTIRYAEQTLLSGIVIELRATDRLCGATVERALSSTGPWEVIRSFSYRVFDGDGIHIFTDALPLDSIFRWYRWKHTAPDRPDSGWSTPVRSFPVILDAGDGDTGGTDGGGGGGGGGDRDKTDTLLLTSFGAIGDSLFLNGIDMVSGSFQAISTDQPFSFETDVSKSIVIRGAGPGSGTLVSVITEVTGGATISLADAASVTVVDAPFMFGTDNRSVIQGVLDMAGDPTASNKNQVFVPAGNFLVDVNDSTASLKIPANVTIRGDGVASKLISFGANSAPLLTNSGSSKVSIKDLSLDGKQIFHTGSEGSTGILLDGADDFELSGLLIESCSAEAICVTASSEGAITKIKTLDNGNGINVVDSSKITLDAIQDSGSTGYGILLNNVQSSSLGTAVLDENGSGSVVEASGSAGNTLLGFFPHLDINIPAPINHPSGGWVQFIEGGPTNPGAGTVQGAIFANYSGTLDDNWLGLVGKVTGSDDLTDPINLTPFFSISLETGRMGISGSSLTIQQEIVAVNGISGSKFTGSYTGAFDGEFGNNRDSFYTGTFTGTLIGSASHAERAVTASHALNAEGLETIRTGSFTGSFIGDTSGTMTGTLVGTASFANVAGELLGGGTGSFTGSVTGNLQLTDNQTIPDGIQVHHALHDLGVQSSSFTASWDDGNIQRYEAGGDVTISMANTNPAGIYVMAIDNTGEHGYRFESASTGILWHGGIVPTPSSGSDVLGFMQFENVIVGYIIAQDAQTGGGTVSFDGVHTGSFTGSLNGDATGSFTGTMSGTIESKKVAYVHGPDVHTSVSTSVAVPFSTTSFLDPDNFSASADLLASEMAIVKNGNYKVHWHATFEQLTVNSATTNQLKLMENIGAGFVNIPNTFAAGTIANNGDNLESVGGLIIRTFASGTLVKCQAQKLSGAGEVAIQSGSYGLVIEEL